ncbi:hypothetical protein AERO9AM_30538 [Aeromicrobium sp. 9AM]|nr:hypothetical protein AERO9AM_30538 [Aeromicrobium sp. 9AM]
MPDRRAYDFRAADSFARDEREVRLALLDRLHEDVGGGVDDVVEHLRIALRVADHAPQRRERLLHEGKAELVHRLEVAVERRRDHTGVAGHLTQADLRKPLLLAQLQRRREDRLPRPLLLGLARGGLRGLGHLHSLTTPFGAHMYHSWSRSRDASVARGARVMHTLSVRMFTDFEEVTDGHHPQGAQLAPGRLSDLPPHD